jgi:VanZ family protein
MNSGATRTPPGVWERWYRRVLPAYWVFLFCATHFPGLRVDTRVPQFDKLAHFVAYGLLAFLLWRFGETFGRPVSAWFAWIALLWLAAYAAVDEYLQSLVGRSASWLDWLCDVTGSAIVLAIMEWRRRAKRSSPATTASQPLDSAGPNN